jgi:hypothetical protein
MYYWKIHLGGNNIELIKDIALKLSWRQLEKPQRMSQVYGKSYKRDIARIKSKGATYSTTKFGEMQDIMSRSRPKPDYS